MPDQRTHLDLSRRERQIMDVLFQRGFATVAEVLDDLPDPPSYSSVRATLRVLEGKGHVRHRQEGLRYLFVPTLAPEKAKRSALEHLLRIFFDGSTERAVATLLDLSASRMSEAELDRLAGLIDQARREEER